MKKLLIVTSIVSLLLIGCGKDNYDEPSAVIRGEVIYNGKSVGVRGTNEVVQLQLYQEGFQLNAPIPVFVGQDGSFTALVSDGRYKLVARNNNGPWVNASTDTVAFEVKGSADIKYAVTPYFTIENVSIAFDADKMLRAKFDIKNVVSSADVLYYSLIVNRTAFVDDAINVWRKEYKDGLTTLNLVEDLSALSQANGTSPLYARVGVLSNKTEQPIYSEVIKIR